MKALTTLSSNTMSLPIANMTSSPLLQALVESLGWCNNVQADISARDVEQRSFDQRVKWAIKNYEQFPNISNGHTLIEQLEKLKKSLRQEKRYAKKQSEYYQKQARKQSKQSYFSLKGIGRWALDNVKEFFGSSTSALIEKYADVAASRQRQITQIEKYLESIQKNGPLIESEADSKIRRELVSVETIKELQVSSSIIIVNPIPNQVALVNQPYSYSLDSVFSGDFTFLKVTQASGTTPETEIPLPSWLSLQYKVLGNFSRALMCYPVNNVVLQGDLLFLACSGTIGLQIFNVSNSQYPIYLSNYLNGVNGDAHRVAVSNNIVFVADGLAGLQILDISNPRNPESIFNYTNGEIGDARGVAVSGNIVFVADGFAGLQILDISNPRNPISLYNYTNLYANGVVVLDNTVFLASGDGLQILDVSNSRNPIPLGNYPAGVHGNAKNIAVSGNIVFVANGNLGLQILDVSNPRNPISLCNYTNGVNGDAKDVVVSGNTVFMANGNAGLQILDVSNPRNPIFLSNYANSNANSVVVSDNTVFVGEDSAGLQILNINQAILIGTSVLNYDEPIKIIVKAYNPTTLLMSRFFMLAVDKSPRYVVPTLLDQSLFSNRTLSIPVQSSSLFTNPSNSFLKLSVASTNSKKVPSWITCVITPQYLIYNVGSSAIDVAVSGNTLFVADGNVGLQILDVSNPRSPIPLFNYPNGLSPNLLPGNACGVAVSGNIAFVADGNAGLQILDVSNPRSPIPLFNYPNDVGGFARGVAVSGNIVFVADGNAGVQILDVSNPRAPIYLPINELMFGEEANGVAVSGNIVFVADGNAGLQILDVSDLRAPTYLPLPNLMINDANSVAVSGNTLFVADGKAGLLILDVSNPCNPISFYNYTNGLSGGAIDVAVSGNTVFVVSGSTGLQILDVSNPRNPVPVYNSSSGVGGKAYGVAVSGNIAFVANGSADLQILDLSYWTVMANMPSVYDAGNYPLQVMATDKFGATANSSTFTIRVEGPPIINGSISIQYAKVNQAFNYFVPQGMFKDPNLDPISFRSTLFDNSPLPSWLSFNGFSAIFAGVPKSTDTGNFTVCIFATDNIFPGEISTYFNLIVNHEPIVSTPIQSQVLRVRRPFNFSVPKQTFSDPDAGLWGVLKYNVTQSNKNPLPQWLQFDINTQTFFGTPLDENVGDLNLAVIASNMFNDVAVAPLTLTISSNVPPRVAQPLSNQVATVNEGFSFTVSLNTFNVFPGDALFYNTSLEGGSSLPNWLSFDGVRRTFSGTPGRADTDYYSPKILSLSVYAYNLPFVYNSYATASFTISVKGVSYLELAVNIFAPIISSLTTLYAMYKSRWIVMNSYNKSQYQRPDILLSPGSEFDYPFKTPLDEIETVEIRLPLDGVQDCCTFLRNYGDLSKKLPGGVNLPHWITYDNETNHLRTRVLVPETRHTEMIVRAIGKDYLITEQFKLIISKDRKQLLDRKEGSEKEKQASFSELPNRSENDSPNSASRSLFFSACCPTKLPSDNKSASNDDDKSLAYTELADLHSTLLERSAV